MCKGNRGGAWWGFMSWDTLAALDQNDTAVRERTREDQAETADFLADLVAHLYTGLQQRSRFPIVGDAPEWAAVFLAHAAGALNWAFKQLLDGYYAHATGSLRNVLAQCNGCCHQPQTVIRSGTVP